MITVLDGIQFREVTVDSWPDLEGLFNARGGPKHCWCMVWRPMPVEDRRAGPSAKKSHLRNLAVRRCPPLPGCGVSPLKRLVHPP